MISKESTLNVLHELRHKYEYGFVTTFNLGISFLENYLLNHVEAFESCNVLNVIMDAHMYDEMLELQRDNIRHANRRYFLLPFQSERNFHPKVALFLSTNSGYLITGSGNLTNAGLTQNAELGMGFRFEVDKGKDHLLPLFNQAYLFLKELSDQSGSRVFRENIERMESEIPWIVKEQKKLKEISFIHSIKDTILSQALNSVDFKIKKLHILSRYFEKQISFIQKLKDEIGFEELVLYTQNGTTTLDPSWIEEQSNRADLKISLVDFFDEESGKRQNLHAKAMVFEGSVDVVIYYGSANCSSNGLLSNHSSGNIESGVVLKGKKKDLGNIYDILKIDIKTLEDITSTSQLVPAIKDQANITKRKYKIQIIEAELEKPNLRLTLSFSGKFTFDKNLNLVIKQGDEKETVMLLLDSDKDFFSIELSKLILDRFGKHCTTIAIYEDKQVISNEIIVVDIYESNSNMSFRTSRRFKDAKIGHHKFFEVMADLTRMSEDEEQLIQFLNFCNIDYKDYMSGVTYGKKHQRGERGGGFGLLKGRGFYVFDKVHEAAMDFIRRHKKRLEKHVQKRVVKGVQNYSQILLSTCHVIYSQLEKVKIGIDENREPLEVNQWSEIRNQIHQYLFIYEEIIRNLCESYFPIFEEKFEDDLDKINNLFSGFIDDVVSFNSELENLCQQIQDNSISQLKVRTQNGANVTPPWKLEDLSPANYPEYKVKIKKMIDKAKHK